MTAERGPFWKCYDPRNVQFRFVVGEGSALTNKGVSSHATLADAARKLEGEFGLVGFVELYREACVCSVARHEAKCRPTAGAAPRGLCLVPSFRPLLRHTARPTTHHWITCPPSIQASLKKLVEKDEMLYLHGLFVFERAVKETGAQLVCREKMERLSSACATRVPAIYITVYTRTMSSPAPSYASPSPKKRSTLWKRSWSTPSK